MDWERYIDEGMLHADEADFESCSHGAIKPTYFIENEDKTYVLQTVQDGEEERLYTTKHIFDRLEESAVPTPAVVHDGSAATVPFYAVEHLDGVNPEEAYPEMPEEDQRRIAEQAGYYLGEAHNELETDSYGEIAATDDRLGIDAAPNWREFFTARMKGKIEYLKAFDEDDDDLVRDAYRVLDSAQHLAPDEPEPGLLHLDYRPGNVLVDDGEITAVLDWDNAIAGDQLYDYVKAESAFADRLSPEQDGDAIRERFRQGYEATGRDVAEDDTYRFYRFCAVLAQTKALRYISRQYDEEYDELADRFHRKLRERQQDIQQLIEM